MPARSKVTPKVRAHEVGDLPPEHEAHQTSKAEVQLLHVEYTSAFYKCVLFTLLPSNCLH